MAMLNFLIKPASSLCNIRCGYCFYEDESKKRGTKSMGLMSAETADLLIDAAFSAVRKGDTVSFAFQGGEPTLAGLPFFQRFTAAVAQRARGVRVQYSIQTNGLSIDDEWAELFVRNRFLVGVSVDGDKALHDECRTDANGEGTWSRVSRGVSLLLRHGVEVNLLCVVTGRTAHCPQKVYSALKKYGTGYLQFIPCLDPLGQTRGSMPYSLTPDDYGKFLCRLFDAWYLDWKNRRYTSVRLFEDYVHLAMGLPASTCATSGRCGSYYVIEADGSIYPCDFYALDEWRMGKLGECSLAQASHSEAGKRFLSCGQTTPPDCIACQWRALCNGGCKRDRQIVDGQERNYYCPSFRQFFSYAAPRIQEIAEAERNLRTLWKAGNRL